MATHSSFLKESGVDGRTIGINSQRQIRMLDGALNPNAAFGKVYWVDAASGSDLSDGLTPEGAFASVEQAITISNAEVGNYDMNTIYVNSGTYTESLTTSPWNANLVGIGAKTRIQGVHTFAASRQNWHFWNIQFRYTAGTIMTITSYNYGIGFHGCTFDSSGATIGISLGGCQDFMLEDCRFVGNPCFTTGIDITGNNYRSVIQNNTIQATTNGILITSGALGYQNIIRENLIGRLGFDPNASAQATYGIRCTQPDAVPPWKIIGNTIEAVDAISYVYIGLLQAYNMCINNHINEAGTGGIENPGS